MDGVACVAGAESHGDGVGDPRVERRMTGTAGERPTRGVLLGLDEIRAARHEAQMLVHQVGLVAHGAVADLRYARGTGVVREVAAAAGVGERRSHRMEGPVTVGGRDSGVTRCARRVVVGDSESIRGAGGVVMALLACEGRVPSLVLGHQHTVAMAAGARTAGDRRTARVPGRIVVARQGEVAHRAIVGRHDGADMAQAAARDRIWRGVDHEQVTSMARGADDGRTRDRRRVTGVRARYESEQQHRTQRCEDRKSFPCHRYSPTSDDFSAASG